MLKLIVDKHKLYRTLYTYPVFYDKVSWSALVSFYPGSGCKMLKGDMYIILGTGSLQTMICRHKSAYRLCITLNQYIFKSERHISDGGYYNLSSVVICGLKLGIFPPFDICICLISIVRKYITIDKLLNITNVNVTFFYIQSY